MRWALYTFILFAIVLGCSTSIKQVYPPKNEILPPHLALPNHDNIEKLDLALKKLALANKEQNSYWWTQYKRAQIWVDIDNNKACDLFMELSLDPMFPLQRLALMRSYQHCPVNHPHLYQLSEFKSEDFDPWLQNVALDIELKSALANENFEKIHETSLKKSQQPISKEDKIFFTEQSLRAAKYLKKEKQEIDNLQKRLYNLSPRLIPSPTISEWNKVAYDYRRVRDFEKAKYYYNKTINSSKASYSQKVSAYKGLAATFKINNQKPESLKILDKLTDYTYRIYSKNKRNYHFAYVYLNTQLNQARAAWTLGHVSEARKILLKTKKQLKGSLPLHQVHWILGRMAEEKQDFSLAVSEFDNAINENIKNKGFRQKVMWYKAWNLRKLKKYDEAIIILTELQQDADNPFDKFRYQFWLAKSHQNLNQKAEAETLFKTLIDEDSLGYYGLIAYREIQKPLPKINGGRAIASVQIMEPRVRGLIQQDYIEWLISVNERDVAKRYLDHIMGLYKEEKASVNLVGLQNILEYYARAGDYLSLFIQLGRLPKEQKEQLISRSPQLIFPTPYHDQVKKAAARYGVSTEFIYAIMRQESAFNPYARSHMDAFGLMQMIPQLAAKTAQQSGVEYSTANDLYKPEVSIPLGAYHLRQLWERFNGNFILAVASYNASEKAINGWINSRYRGNTLEFIEDIPYEETKGYIKLVTRNLVFYQTLESQKAEVPFPEWTLSLNLEEPNKF